MPKYKIIKCKICGKEVRKQYRKDYEPKYCSRECQWKDPDRKQRSDIGTTRAPYLNRECRQCGQHFTILKSKTKNGHGSFCSKECSARSQMTGKPSCNPDAGKRIVFACEWCSSGFEVLPSRATKNPRFCSQKCAGKANSQKRKKKITRKCERCNKIFAAHPCRENSVKFCSRKCMDAAKAARTVVMSCEWCNKPVEVKHWLVGQFRFCSKSCQGKAATDSLNHGRDIPTSIERMLMDELSKRSVEFVREFQVGKYFIDIALVNRKIAIEADGVYWHSLPGRKEHDAKKNGFLKKSGWRVFRFSGDEIRESASGCIDVVTKHLSPPPL